MKHSKWVGIKEEVPYKKLISCTKVTKLRNLSRHKLENKTKKTVQRVKDEGA
jgi:hypothetical protein